MPQSTDGELREICAEIRALSRLPHSAEGEQELNVLARHLRAAISGHLWMSRASLATKLSAITQSGSGGARFQQWNGR